MNLLHIIWRLPNIHLCKEISWAKNTLHYIMLMPAYLAEGFNTPALTVGLNLLDKRVDPGCWLRSGFESPQGLLVVSLFYDPIRFRRFTGVTLYVLCYD